MKKIIASAALVTTLLGSGTAVLAETTTTAPATTSAQATTTTTTAPVTTTTATDTTTTTDPTTTTTAPATTTDTTTATDTTTTTDTTSPLDSTEVALPDPGLTPDKLFYSLKLWIEQIKVVVTRDAAEKADLLQQQAETRLAEAKAMAEAGKMDLAQQAMNEAKEKLAAAQKAIEAANATNKDISKLADAVDEQEAKFTATLVKVLDKAPEEVQTEMAPVVAELLVQVAATSDTATKDDTAKDEADKLTQEEQLKADIATLQPRMALLLNEMAKASGKDLSEVVAMYKAHPGLGVLAKQLGLHMGSIQHATQIQWKSGAKVEVEVKAPATTDAAQTTTDTTAPATTNTTTTTQPATLTTAPATVTVNGLKFEIKTDKDHDDDEDKDEQKSDKEQGKGNGKAGQEHGKSQEEHGKGNANGKGKH